MRKLNHKKVRGIIQENEKGRMAMYSIAKIQKFSPRWGRELRSRYQETGHYPFPKNPGRHKEPIPEEDRQRVLDMKKKHLISGALTLEKLLDYDGEHIPHNKIHQILRENGLAEDEPKKQKKGHISDTKGSIAIRFGTMTFSRILAAARTRCCMKMMCRGSSPMRRS